MVLHIALNHGNLFIPTLYRHFPIFFNIGFRTQPVYRKTLHKQITKCFLCHTKFFAGMNQDGNPMLFGRGRKLFGLRPLLFSPLPSVRFSKLIVNNREWYLTGVSPCVTL